MSKIFECQISNDTEKGNFIGRLMDYPTDKQAIWISIEKLDGHRTNEQNALFHLWIGQIAKQSPNIGSGIVLSVADWKHAVKELGLEKVEIKKLDGSIEFIVKSTKDLKVSEFKEFLDWMQKWAHEFFGGEIILVSNKEK